MNQGQGIVRPDLKFVEEKELSQHRWILGETEVDGCNVSKVTIDCNNSTLPIIKFWFWQHPVVTGMIFRFSKTISKPHAKKGLCG